MTSKSALIHLEQALHNYGKAAAFAGIDPLISRLLVGAKEGLELFVPCSKESVAKHGPLEFLVFTSDDGTPVLPLYTREEYTTPGMPGVCIAVKASDILKNVLIHTQGELAFNPDHDNISLPIKVLKDAQKVPLHSSFVGLEINDENMQTDCTILPNENLDSENYAKTTFENNINKKTILVTLPELNNANDIKKLTLCYQKALDAAVDHGFISIEIIPMGCVEYDLPHDLAMQLVLGAIEEWCVDHHDEVVDIYIACDEQELKEFNKLDF